MITPSRTQPEIQMKLARASTSAAFTTLGTATTSPVRGELWPFWWTAVTTVAASAAAASPADALSPAGASDGFADRDPLNLSLRSGPSIIRTWARRRPCRGSRVANLTSCTFWDSAASST